jgi:polyhydroxybutyrate depolymerase
MSSSYRSGRGVRILALLALLLWAPMLRAAGLPCDIGAPGATRRVPVGDSGRSMLIHLPAGYDAHHPAPLVFLLHGSGGSGAAILAASGLIATADAHGFVVAAPDGGIPSGDGFVWNIPGVPSTSGRMPVPTDADDVGFIRQATDWLAARHCVDRTRIYATGLSGGGRMSSWLGCVAADRFAAIAPVVGLRAGNPSRADPRRPDAETCRPSRPMPVIAFAGDKDGTNPIEGGGAVYWQYPMKAAEERWAELDGCPLAAVRRDLGPLLYEDLYAPCRGGAEVVARITIGGEHRWLADNEAMWAFFARHPLKR